MKNPAPKLAHDGNAPAFILNLLDPNLGSPLIRWKFPAQSVVRIGRDDQNQIAISDPSVSRNHAELHWQGTHWKLVNLGRNGTLVDGAQVTEAALKDGGTFRLGPIGPILQLDRAGSSTSALATAAGCIDEAPCIEIDHSQKERQVSEITDSNYFQQLQQMVKQMKDRTPGKPEVLPK